MKLVSDNPLLLVLILAVIAAVIVVVSGHAVDGSGLLTALFTIMGLAGGLHANNNAGVPNATASDSTVADSSKS